jgi:hypothetical protein
MFCKGLGKAQFKSGGNVGGLVFVSHNHYITCYSNWNFGFKTAILTNKSIKLDVTNQSDFLQKETTQKGVQIFTPLMRALYAQGKNVQIEIVWTISLIYFFLNIFVSVLVSKRVDLEHVQKVAQIIVIWIIPFIAAIGIWLFHRNSDRETLRVDSFAKRTRDESLPQD